jgi:pimeloyl-ACP methyl ester carboxylesterase
MSRGNPSQPPVFDLAGGPGEGATASTEDDAALLGPVLAKRDLIVFDQRGTGKSGALHCSGIENGDGSATALPACAQQLGRAAHHYTSVDSADDIDSIRTELGADRITIFGTSYGTWVAQVYARRHPAHVESLVLDSTVSTNQIEDGFQVDIFRSLRRGVRAYCEPSACRVLTHDLYSDGVKLYRRLVRKTMKAPYFDGSGKRQSLTINAIAYALLVVGSDIHAEERAELPRAVATALEGDGRLLARMLAQTAIAGSRAGHGINPSLNLVTQCEEKDMEFDRSADAQTRLAQAQDALAKIPASAFDPFSPQLAFLNSLVPQCAYWPSLSQRPDFGGAVPDVPALVLHGDQDLRTTSNDTKVVAGLLPRSTVLNVPQTGHSTNSSDVTGCVQRALRRFLTGAAPGGCPAIHPNPYAPRPIPPRRIGSHPLRLVADTVADGFQQLDDVARRDAKTRTSTRLGGLQGGALHGGSHGPTFVRSQYVRGLAVSGLVTKAGTVRLTVSGKVTGKLAFRPNGRVSGRLGGKRVHAKLKLTRETTYEALRRRGLLPG